MINLYELLSLRPDASEAEIRAAVQALSGAGAIDPKVTKAVHEWLLVESVRRRYDEKLRMEQPEWFAGLPPQPNRAVREQVEPTAQMPRRSYAAEGRPTYRIGSGKPKPKRTDMGLRPHLWNPKAAALWALFLSPLFAWLHAENWDELGEPQKAKKNRFFVFFVMGFALGTTLITVVTGFQIPLYASALLWIGWFLTMGREQIDFVRSKFGDDYERRSWGKAFGLVALAFVGLLFAAAVLALLAQIAGIAHPSFLE